MLKKLYIAITLAAVLSLLAPAAYAAEGTTTGSFGAASSTPEVTAVDIYDTTDPNCTGSPITDMTPQTEYYYAKISVTSNSKLKQLETVQVTLFYNDGTDPNMSAPVAGDVYDCAILTCTIGAPPGYAISWSYDFGTSITWELHEAGCQSPTSLDDTSGDWIFAFRPGKVARENTGAALWNVQGYAENRNDAKNDDLYVRNKNMMWYGEVTVADTADWGEVPLGLTFDDITSNPETGIDVTYIANGDYYEDISSEDWTSGGETVTLVSLATDDTPPANPGEFALKANWENNLTVAQIVTENPTYAHIKSDETITTETGNLVNTNTLWLSLSDSGILPGTYTGTIWYQIVTR